MKFESRPDDVGGSVLGIDIEILNHLKNQASLNIENIKPENYAGKLREMTLLYVDAGLFDLAKKASRAQTKAAITKIQENREGVKDMGEWWAHYLHHAYMCERRATWDDNIKKTLGEMDAQIGEAFGRFDRAYRQYEENNPEKYGEKLRTANNNPDTQKEIDDRINNSFNYPDFKMLSEEEADALADKLFAEFAKVFSESEFAEIDPKLVILELIDEVRKKIGETIEQD